MALRVLLLFIVEHTIVSPPSALRRIVEIAVRENDRE
jgi:hypothetical protein